MRAVQTQYGSLVHLDTGGSKTFCGIIPFKNAKVTHRKLMCMNCFGKDHGLGEWTAARLGMEKIYEEKKDDST